MSIKEIQDDVDKWTSQFKIQYWPPLSILAAISEEVGELAREVNDRYGGRVKKSTDQVKELEEEISDIIFNCICLANSHNIDLDKAWEKKMSKVWERDKDRYEKK